MFRSPVLITGCNRGLGLEMVKQLSKMDRRLKPEKVIAVCRNPDKAEELQKIADKKPDVVVIKQLDVTNFDKLPNFVNDIEVISINLSHNYPE